jgi:hypothetical protein
MSILIWNSFADMMAGREPGDQPNKSLELTPEMVFWFAYMSLLWFASRW